MSIAWSPVLFGLLLAATPGLGSGFRVLSTKERRLAQAVPPSSYLGCYADSSSRALPNQLSVTGSMTVEACNAAAAAAGYQYFGVQYASQCFAGNSITQAQQYGTSGNCNMACAGNSAETCGGSWANSLYATSVTFPAVSGYTLFLNLDSPGNDISFTSVTSVQACAALCSGNSACVGFDYIASGPSAPSQPLCIPKSAIVSSLQSFGSGNIGSLYKKASGPAPAPAPASPSYLGCYTDSNSRALPNQLSVTGSMTVEACNAAAAAAGYQYFGVQYASQCFAGSSLTQAQQYGTSGNCNMACAGNAAETCGGSWANSLYATSVPNFPVLPAYTLFLYLDSPGNDISFNTVSSVQACAALCSGNAACVGFDYIVSGPAAPSAPLCIPKSAITSSLQAFGPGNLGSLYKKGP